MLNYERDLFFGSLSFINCCMCDSDVGIMVFYERFSFPSDKKDRLNAVTFLVLKINI